MLNEFDLLSVVFAATAAFIVGAVWYSPMLFLGRWTAEAGINPNQEISNPVKVYGLTFLYTLLASFSMSVILPSGTDVLTAISTALVLGVGIVAGSLGINYQFAMNSTVHWFIDSGFHIVRLVVIALVLSY